MAVGRCDAVVTHALPVCSLTPLPPPLRLPLQANLVAAFEQSLALMTARLQTLSVSSDQKVHTDLKLKTLH